MSPERAGSPVADRLIVPCARQFGRDGVGGEIGRLSHLGRGSRLARLRGALVHDQDPVATRVIVKEIDTCEPADCYVDPDLFTRFAARRRAGRFIVLDVPGGKAPTAHERFGTATNEEHPGVTDDERGRADLSTVRS